METPARQILLEPLLHTQVAAAQLPTVYADAVGATYVASRSDADRKRYGLYLTPRPVAAFMARLIEPKSTAMRLLDPAAGAGILLCAALERLVLHPNRPRMIELVACEIDGDLGRLLRMVLDHAISWAANQGVTVTATVRHQDFVLANAHVGSADDSDWFDVVIANPPYFKIGKDDPRALAVRHVVHGQPNIYGLFMAIAATMLRPGGELLFITPRSYASGPYFKRFRELFFGMMRPLRAHVFGSRREAFSRDNILQENMILHAIRDDDWIGRPERLSLTLSSSAGITDLARSREWDTTLADVLNVHEAGSVFRLPATPEDEAVLRLVDGWPGSLRSYGLQISTGPVVPFRATKWLTEQSNSATVPLLWMNHVHAMDIRWPNGKRKAEYIIDDEGSRRLLLPARNYVLLRRFSAKEERRRLTAAPLLAESVSTTMIGVENHLNYIHRPAGNLTRDEVWGLAALYNSALLDTYFRCVNGNTQVGAIELRAMPLPPIDQIVALGQRLQRHSDPVARIDELVMDLVRKLAPVGDDAVA